MNIHVPIEEAEALLSAIEGFFGPDIFAPMTTSEPKTAALNKAGVALKRHVDKKRNNEEAAKRIMAVFQANRDIMDEGNMQEFLDNEVHDSASREGSDVNNAGQEEQLFFLIEELGEEEVRRLLNATFEGVEF